MSDDVEICGHPTQGGDGPPCQNAPSRDDGRCHLHTDDDPVSVGRHFAIEESDHEDILDAARLGMSKAGCARAAGVDKASLLRYLDAHEQFRMAYARARAEGEQRLARDGLMSDEVDTSMAKFLLSTSFDYVKTEKRELEDVTDGSDGFGTTIVLDSEYVDDE